MKFTGKEELRVNVDGCCCVLLLACPLSTWSAPLSCPQPPQRRQDDALSEVIQGDDGSSTLSSEFLPPASVPESSPFLPSYAFDELDSTSPIIQQTSALDAQIVRYDRPNPFSRNNLAPQRFASSLSPPPPYQRLLQIATIPTPAAIPFNITFTCQDVSNATCAMARSSFESAAKRISEALFIVNTIHISAFFHSFCAEQPAGNCSRKNTLGQASAAAYFSARPANVSTMPWFFYPQALVKQLKQDFSLKYNPFDIVAEFNSDFNFWYSGSGTPIQPSQTDFEFVVAHEISHGLGIESSLIQWSTAFSKMDGISSSSLRINTDFLAPPFNARGTTLSTAKVVSWQPFSIFDAQLVDAASGRAVRDIARDVFAFNPANMSFVEFVNGFQNSGAPYRAAQAIYSLATSNGDAIRFPLTSTTSPSNPSTPVSSSLLSTLDASILTLQTTATFSPGTSIVHVAYGRYWTSTDFLMIPAVQDWAGWTLDAIMANVTESGGKVYGVYGAGTMGMLAAMGWGTRDSMGVQGSVFINPNPDGPVVVFTSGAGNVRIAFLAVVVGLVLTVL
ncbi:hypothetical protein BC829DRAFT_492273 [Chytridium lagenaria]|nr:hypothetical protein BC829DRAFT_492273 [Chytridium lagenaria]